CPRGRVAEVQTGGNLGTGVIYALTLGIYTPRKVYVTCAADQGGQARSVAEVQQ
ncbi:MAG: Bor/Iss family lipoprotein, partial [Myxococcales bacterium]